MTLRPGAIASARRTAVRPPSRRADADRVGTPLRVCLISGSDLVHHGVAALLAPFAADVAVDLSPAVGTPDSCWDVVLYDLATSSPHQWAAARSIPAACVVLLAWSDDWREAARADLLAADGLVTARLDGRDLARALRDVVDCASAPQTCWPYQTVGLSRRESEALLHIAGGEGNQDIASSMYVSINSLKGYIRSCYAKIGVTTRTEAVLWAIQHRFPSAHEHPTPRPTPRGLTA